VAYSVSLQTALDRVSYLGDLEGQSARHTGLVAEINQAMRELREMALSFGWEWYRRVSPDVAISAVTTALPTVSVVNVAFAERVLAVHLTVTKGGQNYLYELPRGSQAGAGLVQAAHLPADAWLPQSTSPRERPLYLPSWEVVSLDGAGAQTPSSGPETDSGLWLYPVSGLQLAQGSPRLQVTYLPHYVDVTNTSHMLRFAHPSAYTWAVATVAHRSVAIRDGSANPRAKALAEQAQAAAQQLAASVPAAPPAHQVRRMGRADR
jgi:hypothetical protein